ncbi:MAG TPA: DUF2442 domain-containing protein [Aggregatilineales bacterium]|nr:DUF2442 domain-containing protein [Aggregatilineales bacterium]
MIKQNEAPRPQDRPVNIAFSEDMLIVRLADGREIATPLAWYPRLLNATLEQRQNAEFSLTGIHWRDLDEDLSVVGMLRGNHPPQYQPISSKMES